MEQEFKYFRQEVRADIELTQGLLRDTIKRQQKQEELLEQHALMLKQQSELVGSLMHHQLEGIQDFRKLEKSFGGPSMGPWKRSSNIGKARRPKPKCQLWRSGFGLSKDAWTRPSPLEPVGFGKALEVEVAPGAFGVDLVKLRCEHVVDVGGGLGELLVVECPRSASMVSVE